MNAQNPGWVHALYRYRWLGTALVLALVAALLAVGGGRLAEFSTAVDSLHDTPPATAGQPKVFDVRYDIWFDPDDPGLQTYRKIEDKFSAEDFVLIGFEERDAPRGVFDPRALGAIERLTRALERVPYVRNVRSITSNPWIRWGVVEAGARGGDEYGLLVSDLFEHAVASYSSAEQLERMIAVLGAERTAGIVGEAAVRGVLGTDADFAQHIGEPRLLGAVVSPDARVTTIQVQLLRPRLDAGELRAAFGDDATAAVVGPAIYTNEAQWSALDRIDALLAEERVRSGYEFHVAGMPLFERNFMVVGEQDLSVVGYMFLCITFVLFVLLRRLSGVVISLLVVGSAVAGMLGAIWVLGDLLNNVTATTPNLITAIGIADAIHLIAAYLVLRRSYTDRRQLVEEVIRRNAMPVLLTSITTAVGFFSLASSNIVPMSKLGYTAGIGTLLAWAITMTVVPALLSLLPIPGERARAPEPFSDRALNLDEPHWSDRLVSAVMRHRLGILATSALVAVTAVVGLIRLEVDTDFRTMFPDDNRVMVDFDWIESRMGGGGDLEIVFEAPAADESPVAAVARQERISELRVRELAHAEELAAAAPLSRTERAELERLTAAEADSRRRRIATRAEFLTELERFIGRLEEERTRPESPLRIVTKIESPLDILRKVHQAQHENRGTAYRLPTAADVPALAREPVLQRDPITEDYDYLPRQDTSTLVAQYYLQYENGAKPSDNLGTVISADRRTFRVQGRVAQAPSVTQQRAFDRVREIAAREFPRLAATVQDVESGEALATMTLSGKVLLYAGMTEKFTAGFVRSMGLALLVITLLIALIYRSWWIGLLSLVPNVLPIVLPIGLLGFTGATLDGPAVMVASVALGVCVDDSIHFFTKFTHARTAGFSTADAVRATFRQVGAALCYTTVILVLGFSVLATSQFKPNSMMGQLAVVMIGLAWVADFIVTPAILSYLPVAREAQPDRAGTRRDRLVAMS